MTQRHQVSYCCWKNATKRLAQHRAATNLQSVKTTQSAEPNKMRYAPTDMHCALPESKTPAIPKTSYTLKYFWILFKLCLQTGIPFLLLFTQWNPFIFFKSDSNAISSEEFLILSEIVIPSADLPKPWHGHDYYSTWHHPTRPKQLCACHLSTWWASLGIETDLLIFLNVPWNLIDSLNT